MTKEENKEIPDEDLMEKQTTISPSELIMEQLAQKTKEASEFKDKYLRSLAEMENTKKRLVQEKKELVAFSISNIVEDLLTPIDNLENALSFTDNLSDELKNWATGFKMILAQFKEALENHGITSYETVGKTFDPHLHEAVELIETSEQKDGTIIKELTKGYRMDARIIRVAKVKVAKNIKEEDKN